MQSYLLVLCLLEPCFVATSKIEKCIDPDSTSTFTAALAAAPASAATTVTPEEQTHKCKFPIKNTKTSPFRN